MPNPTPLPVPADDLRLVVSDMDGTLLDGDGNIPSQLWPLLDTMKDRGIAFVPASGRQFTTLSTMFQSHLQGMPIIAENGTYVVRDGVDISSSVIDSELARRVIVGVRHLRDDGHNVGLVVATKSIAYLERADDPFVSHVSTYYHSHTVVDDLTEHTDDVIKLSIYDFGEASNATYPDMQRVAAEHQVILATPNWVDIMNPGVNKGSAVAAVQRDLGVTSDQTAIFGDFLNDLEMMPLAAWSFAMANGHPDIIEAANYVAPPNTDNGVITVLAALLGVDVPGGHSQANDSSAARRQRS
ncbi:HAD family hydrolase [Cutibacterium sp. WCA-380-WT-3A]|uniref:HAD family hydrolase n=1 Tax=Cutibacterium porci TaxID=2605781 RepID=A0A7K0J668_9ACTN|nr:Cof-type HAD-IIB family hydrolase [Cutibacterium porci]MSS45445.1 HAD family hydrolase [Cutibacterium porci]